jgi:CheY-like chemotaxis protein
MGFLRREGDFSDAPRPDIVLLDLNMPKMDGRAVLSQLKADPNLMTIPVVVLTTSEAEEDILNSYELHANCYVQKPVDLDKFMSIIGLIENFWLSVVRLPPTPHAA